ncbi:hypothetical protein Aperf_G00000019157 [Anoplocephala perfoliata]
MVYRMKRRIRPVEGTLSSISQRRSKPELSGLYQRFPIFIMKSTGFLEAGVSSSSSVFFDDFRMVTKSSTASEEHFILDKPVNCLSQTQNILRMVEFIRQGPDLSKPLEHQYDLACQVEFLFLQDVSSVREAFLSSPETLDALYSILDDDKASQRLSTLTLTCRIFSSVFQEPSFLQFLATKPELVSTFLRHVDNTCVRDLFLSLLNIEESSALVLLQALDEQRFIQRLLKLFLTEESKEFGANVEQKIIIGQFLCQIMFVLRKQSQNSDDGQTSQPLNPLLIHLESEQTVVQVVEAIVTAPVHRAEMLPYFLDFLHHLYFTVAQLDIGVSVPTLPNHQTKGNDDFESKGLSSRHLGLLFPILPYLKPHLHLEGPAYDAEDNAKISRSRLPLQPLGQVRIHIARFLCHLLFHCRGEEGAEIVERVAELDFIGDLTDLFFAFKWNSLMHATLHFFTQMLFRRAFNYSPVAPSSLPPTDSSADVTNVTTTSSLSANHNQNNLHQQQPQQLQQPDAKSVDKVSSHLSPYAKIVHQLLVKHKFLDRLMSAWTLDKSLRGQLGYRRPGYLGHLQEIAVHLTSYLLPDEFKSLNISVRDEEMALTEEEDRYWQRLQDRRQRRSEKPCQANGDLPQMVDLSADGENDNDSLDPQIVLRKQLLLDIPPQSYREFVEFVSGDLCQAVSVSNVEHLRDLKSTLVIAPSPSRLVLPDSAPSVEAAIEAYNKYRNASLTSAFNEVFGRDESEFDPRIKCLEEKVETMFQDLCTSLVLPEDTLGSVPFDQVSNATIRAPDGVEVGDASSGFPVECIEDTMENASSRILRSPLTNRDSNNFNAQQEESSDQLNRCLSANSQDWLINIFDEAHKEVMMESEDDSPLSSGSDFSEAMRMDFFQSALSPSPAEQLRNRSPILNEVVSDREQNELERELEARLSLVPMPTKSNGKPTLSIGRSKRFHQVAETHSDPSSPLDERWTPPTSRSLGVLHSPDLPDSDSVVLPRLILDSDSKINSSAFQPRSSLPRPIQPTVRSHRFTRTPLLTPTKNGGEALNGSSNPLRDPNRRKRLLKPLDFEDGDDELQA